MRDFSCSAPAQRKDHERMQKEGSRLQPWGEPSPGSRSAGTLTLNFQPPKLWEMNVCCWNHPASSALLRQPKWTNKLLCSSHAWSTHNGFVSNSCQHMTPVPLSASNQLVSPETNFPRSPFPFFLIRFSLHRTDFFPPSFVFIYAPNFHSSSMKAGLL